MRRRFVARRTFPVMTPDRCERLETIVAVPFLFPLLSRALLAVRDEVLGVGSGPAACSYKVVIVLAQATDPGGGRCSTREGG